MMKNPRRAPLGHLAEEEGAIAVMAAVLVFAVLAAGALAVDVGRVAYASRDQQGATDRAALDTVRLLHENRPADANTRHDLLGPVHEAAEQSLERNLGSTRGTSEDRMIDEVHLGYADEDGRFVLLCGRDYLANELLEPEPGDCDAALDSSPYVDAVNLVTSSSVPYVLPLGSMRGAELTKAGFARAESVGSVRVGSQLANMDSRKSALLNELFSELLCPPVDELSDHTCDLSEPDVDIGAAGWEAIADAEITFGDLMDGAAAAGSSDQLLDTKLSMEEWLSIVASALDNQGNETAAAHVQALAGAIDTQHGADVSLAGEEDGLYDVAVGQPGSAASAGVDVMDVLRTGAMVANGDRVIDVPGLDVEIPGLSSISGRMSIGEAPRQRIGRPGETTASTAQVRVALNADLVDLNLLGLTGVEVSVPLYLDLAGGEASLDAIRCGDPHDEDQVDTHAEVTGTVRTTGLMIGDLGDDWLEGGDGTADWAEILRASVSLLGLERNLIYEARANSTLGGPSETLSYNGPYRTEWQSVNAGTAGISQLEADLELRRTSPQGSTLVSELLSTLGIDSTEELTDEVRSLVGEVLADLEDELLSDVADALGLDVGRADVRMLSVDCSHRGLGPLE